MCVLIIVIKKNPESPYWKKAEKIRKNVETMEEIGTRAGESLSEEQMIELLGEMNKAVREIALTMKPNTEEKENK